jgi:hypothetical protein
MGIAGSIFNLTEDHLKELRILEKKLKTCWIKVLPAAIYRIIQEYLEVSNYNSLMNSNKEIFQPIKEETVVYSLSVRCDRPFNLERLERFYSLVKDRSNQCDIDIDSPNVAWMNQYGKHFAGIRLLSIWFPQDFHNQFDFSILEGTRKIELYCGEGITKLSSKLESLEELTLADCFDLVEINESINSKKKLKKLEIGNSKRLKYLLPIDTIERIDIYKADLSLLQVPSFPLADDDDLPDPRRFPIKELKLYKAISGSNAGDLMNFAFIQRLKLHFVTNYHHPANVYYPPFPARFLGFSLELDGLNLSAWSNNTPDHNNDDSNHVTDERRFPNLTHLSLRDSIGLTEFPRHLPKLRFCSLQSIRSLVHMNSSNMPKCRRIELSSCSELISLPSSLPSLQCLFMSDCRKAHQLPSFARNHILNYARITHCNALDSINPLNNVKDMQIDTAPGLINFDGFEQSEVSFTINFYPRASPDYQLRTNGRRLELTNITSPLITSFHGLSNLYQLILQNVPSFSSCHGLKNLHYLIVVDCPALVSTEGLGKIHSSLIIRCCSRLRELVEIESIPYLELDTLPDVEEIRGLRDHHQVYIHQVGSFDHIFLEYAASSLVITKELEEFREILSSIDICKTQQNGRPDLSSIVLWDREKGIVHQSSS